MMEALVYENNKKTMAVKRRRRRKKFKLRSKPSVYVKKDGSKVKMDSTWEVAMATKLDELCINWERHINETPLRNEGR